MAKGKEIWVCPQCGAQVDISSLGLYAEVTCPRCYRLDRVHVQLGNFRLENVLGIGGMSVVYRAMDVTLNRHVALKVLNDTFREQPERIERFENESAMMARVRHENVTSVYSAGRAYGQFYIAMELVEGKNLEHMVSPQKPLDAAFSLEVVRQVAKGLRAANEAGLLHRDMKPGNILVAEGNKVKVIDFGLALDDKAGDTEEVIWATPYYVPPETLQRQPEDVRTDIYALGMTLRYLLTGVERFDGETDSVTGLLNCKKKQPPFAKQRPDLNATLCDLVDHMTQFQPSGRPANYDELLEEIGEVEQVLTKERQGPGGSKIKRVGAKVGVLALVVAVGLWLANMVQEISSAGKERPHATVEMEKVDVMPESMAHLQKGLSLLEAGKCEEAVESFLATSREEQDPCVAAWAAYLARTVTEIVPIVDGAAKREEAQKELDLHVNEQKAHSAYTEKFLEYLRKNAQRLDPSPSGWAHAQDGWPEQSLNNLTPETVEQMTQGDTPMPMVPVKLMELAEMALWHGRNDIVDACYAGIKATRGSMGMYKGLGETCERVFMERLKVRRSAKYQGTRQTLLQQLRSAAPSQENVELFQKISQEKDLPPRQHLLAEIESEAALIGMKQAEMLLRKAPKAVRANMPLAKMAETAYAALSDRPIVIARNEYQGYVAANVNDGDIHTRWCAEDTNSGPQLLMRLPRPQRVDRIVIYWGNKDEQGYLVQVENQEKVYDFPIQKKEDSSTLKLNGEEVQEVRIQLTAANRNRASVSEIEFYDTQGRRLYDPEKRPKIIQLETDSAETENVAKLAMDGDTRTRWCAANALPGHFLLLKTDRAKEIKKIRIYWENNSQQAGAIEGFSGSNRVDYKTFSKNTEQSEIELSGTPLTALRIKMTDMGPNHSWASIREIELFDKKGEKINAEEKSKQGIPQEVVTDIMTVASVLSAEPSYYMPNLEKSITCSRSAQNSFRTIAASWHKRFKEEANVLSSDTKMLPLKGNRDLAFATILDKCRHSVRVKLNEGKIIGFLNCPNIYRSPKEIILDEQQALFLLREGVVSVVSGKQMPMLALKTTVTMGVPLYEGEITPVPEEKVSALEREKSAVPLYNMNDLRNNLDKLKENPTPRCFLLELVYWFQ